MRCLSRLQETRFAAIINERQTINIVTPLVFFSCSFQQK